MVRSLYVVTRVLAVWVGIARVLAGGEAMIEAARNDDQAAVAALLGRRVDVNARDKKFGQTALMWAAGHPAVVRLLVDRGADIRVTTSTWNVKYTIYAPTTATLGKTGIPWNTDGDYTSKKGGYNTLFFAVQ